MVKSMNASLKIPHFGFADTMSLTALKALRADVNAYLGDKDMARKLEASGLPSKLSFMPFFIKSFSMALRDFPLLNAQFVDSATPPHVLYRPDHNVGIAVDTPNVGVGGVVQVLFG